MALDRSHPLNVLRGLMVAENLGDVHDEIDLLHDHYGIPRPEGDFFDGWTRRDRMHVDEFIDKAEAESA